MRGVPKDGISKEYQAEYKTHLHPGRFIGFPSRDSESAPYHQYDIWQFWLSQLDFYGTESRLCMLPTKEDLGIPWRTIMIGQRVKVSGADTAFFPQQAQLVVPTRKYETCKMDDNLVYSGGAPRSAYARYAIDSNSEGFPTASQLDAWGRNCLLERCHLPDSRPYIIMDKFLILYLKAMPDFRHVSLPSPSWSQAS